MENYKVVVSRLALDDLEMISDFIVKLNTTEASRIFVSNLYDDIQSLSYLAAMIPLSTSNTLKKIHPNAKRLLSKNKKWNIVFYINEGYVVVDRIILSKTVK